MAPRLDAIPPVRGKRGRPDKLHADKAYDARARRQECRARGILPRIARHGIESSRKLGRHRWVVERTHAWFNTFRRLRIRYERRDDISADVTLQVPAYDLKRVIAILGTQPRPAAVWV